MLQGSDLIKNEDDLGDSNFQSVNMRSASKVVTVTPGKRTSKDAVVSQTAQATQRKEEISIISKLQEPQILKHQKV